MLLSLGLIAGVAPVATGVVLADRQPPSGTNSQANPDFAAACGTDVVLVLDESGSIKDTSGAEAGVVAAVKSFVTGLNGTGSRIRIVEFGTNARDAKVNGSTGFQTVNGALVTAVNTYLDGSATADIAERYNPLYPDDDYWTNWEAGLNEALAPQVDGKNGAPLVVFITDGVPNTVGTNGSADPGNSGGVNGNQAAADAAINEIELLQARPGHVLGVGVGTAVTGNTFDRLANLVEPKTTGTNARSVWSNSNDVLDIRTTDLLKVSNFANLPDAISRVVYALCSPSLTLKKVDQTGAAISGLDFTATVDVKSSGSTSGSFQWVKPGNEIQTGATAKTVTTGSNGSALFQWTPGTVASPQTWDSVATFTETLRPGWTLSPSTLDKTVDGAACTVNRFGQALPIKVALKQELPAGTPQPGDTVKFSLVTSGATNTAFRIQKADIVSCTVKNIAPGTITVAKTTSPANTAGNFTFTTNYATTAPDKILAHGESFVSVPLVSGTYTVKEAAQVGWDLQSVSCGAPGADGTVTVNLAAGQNVTCTFVNKSVPLPKIDVTKTASPTTFQETTGTVTYSLVVTNTGTEKLTLSALTDAVRLNNGATTTLDLALANPGTAAGATITGNTCNSKIGVEIAAGGSVQCSFTAPYTGASAHDLIADTVTATGKDKFNRTVTDTADALVDVTDKAPVITVDKQNVEPVAIVAPGGLATYNVVVTNGPNAIENITITSVVDQLRRNGAPFGAPLNIGAMGGPVTATTCGSLVGTVLAPAASTSCTFTVNTSVIGALAQSDALVNTVTVTAVDNDGTSVTGDDLAPRTVLGAAPQIAVFKSDHGAFITEPASQITYTVDIHNLGTTEAVTIQTITDDVFFNGAPIGTITIPSSDPAAIVSTLPAGTFASTDCTSRIGAILARADAVVGGVPTNATASTQCSITLNLAGNAGDGYSDKVTVSGIDETGDPVSADNSADTPAFGKAPQVAITKSPNKAIVPETGGEVTFTFTITNTSVSTDPLTLTSLTDTVFGDLFAASASGSCKSLVNTILAPSASVQCTYTTTLSGTVAVPHGNTVTVIGVDDEGDTASAQASAKVNFSDVAPSIVVTKTPNPNHVSEHGGDVTYTVTVQNTSLENVTLTSLLDDRFDNITDAANPKLVSTSCATGGTITPAAVYSCNFVAHIVQVAGATSHINVVTANAVDDEGTNATDDARAEVIFDLVPPSVTITKTDTGASVNEPGGPVTYFITVNNTSAEHVAVTSLIDTIQYAKPVGTPPIVANLLNPAAPVVSSNCGTQLATGLDAGQSIACSFVVQLAGTAQDVDDIVAISVIDDDQQSAGAEAQELTPIHDVPPTVAIDKTANPTAIEPGENVTYKFVITNPGTTEAITLLSLIDDKFGDLTAECFNGATVVLQPNDGVAGEGADQFTCSVVRAPAGDGVDVTSHINVATVTAADDEILAALNDDDPQTTADPVWASDAARVEITRYDATITVTKTDSVPDSELVVVGQQYNYALSVTNNGPSPVEQVTLADDLPTGLELVSVAGGTGWTCNNTDPVACAYGPGLAAGQTTTTVTVTVKVAMSFVGDALTNTAIGTAVVQTPHGPKTVTDDDIEITPLTRTIDVTGFSPECVNDAPYISYNIVPLGFVPTSGNATLTFFDKNGNQVGNPVQVTSLQGRVVYPGATVVDGVATDWPGWKFENGVWVQDPSDAVLRDGLTIRVQVNPEATATVTYPPATSACADPKQPSADLAIVKSTTNDAPVQGGSFSWVLDITNNGPSTAVNVVVSDVVPGPLTVTAVDSSAFACGAVGNTVTCNVASLAVGATGRVLVTVGVPGNAVGTIINVASVTASTPDPNLNNNTDDAIVSVIAVDSLPPVVTPPSPPTGLPITGTGAAKILGAATALFALGWFLLAVRRRRRRTA